MNFQKEMMVGRRLAERGIGIFAISSFDTDYILTKTENYSHSLEALKEAGYVIIEPEY